MTEKRFRDCLNGIYRKFEHIQVSKVNVERIITNMSDILNVEMDSICYQVGYMFSGDYRWFYITVNDITVCEIINSNMSLQVFYNNISSTLLNMLDDINKHY